MVSMSSGFSNHARALRWSLLLLSGLFAGLTTAPVMADLPVFKLIIKDARFNPQTLEVPAGKKFKLHVKNEGPGVEEFESTDLNRENIVPPGGSLEIFLGPLEPGTYKFFGDFHPDTAQGRIVAK